MKESEAMDHPARRTPLNERLITAAYEVSNEKQRSSTIAEMDRAITLLQAQKDIWSTTPVGDKIEIIESVIDRYYALCEEWVDIGLRHKRANHDLYAQGWEWAAGPMPILRYLRGLRNTLIMIHKTGDPPWPQSVNTRSNGQVSAKVYPSNLYERISTPGTTVEVWMDRGLALEEVRSGQATPYKQVDPKGKLCLVLGAGNVSGIPVNDSLSKLFVDNSVVLLKMNPVNSYLGPLIEDAFEPLISQGYLMVVYGGAEEGSYLCHHPDVDCIHMTGSDRTYETIVFGSGPDGRRRKEEHSPICKKPFTAELGNIAPAIIVPGPWSDKELQYQAEQIASHLCDTGSYSCSRTRVIVQYAHWDLRDKLMDKLREVLSRILSRIAYYPHAIEQFDRFVSSYPQAQLCGTKTGEELPWTLIPDLDSRNMEELCFREETFCPIIAETSIGGSSVAEFLEEAVGFSNRNLWGTLSASIIVHPDSLREPGVKEAVDRAIDNLRYGIVTVNCLPGLVWGITVPPWGSFPGNPPWDIQSGVGYVHNLHMFSAPQKTILRGPFQATPRPPWFPSRAKKMGEITKRVVSYEAKPSLFRMLRILVCALG
jgi:acyl-CoA reductase-like NAD-dependent aldehyde dehydrogenase